MTIGYGDQAGYDGTAAAVRDAAHAYDARLRQDGVVMGVAGRPAQVRHHDAAGVTAQAGAYVAVATRYVDALNAGDFPTVASMFADDIVWHQPGGNAISGTYRGAAAVGELLGNTMTISEGTFKLAVTGAPMVNGDACAFPVHFSGERSGADLSMDGVDVLRIEGEKIAEVWLFSAVQAEEDAFWGAR